MKWFMLALKNYANFSGRARRKEYWYFTLFFLLFYVLFAVMGAVLGLFWPVVLFAIAMIIPSLSVAARRMHDTGHSAWYMFIPIYSLILACTNGTAGDNGWGADPKQPQLYNDVDLIGANPQ